VVEENCPITPPDPEPEPEPEPDMGADDMGAEDMGEAPAPGSSDSSDDGCGCATVDQKQDSPYGLVVLGLFGAFILRRFL
jgi:MYXO-CTERM domain-containing protein